MVRMDFKMSTGIVTYAAAIDIPENETGQITSPSLAGTN
jgi:hypothetical protein